MNQRSLGLCPIMVEANAQSQQSIKTIEIFAPTFDSNIDDDGDSPSPPHQSISAGSEPTFINHSQNNQYQLLSLISNL